MSRQALAFGLAFAAFLSPNLPAQPLQSFEVKLTTLQSVPGPLAFSNPSLGVKGTIRAQPGDRFVIVVIALGDGPMVSEVRHFVLVLAGGVKHEPVAVGGGPDLIFPLDSLPLGVEVGQILPSDAILAVK